MKSTWTKGDASGNKYSNGLMGRHFTGYVVPGDFQLLLLSISSRKLHACCQADSERMPRNRGHPVGRPCVTSELIYA